MAWVIAVCIILIVQLRLEGVTMESAYQLENAAELACDGSMLTLECAEGYLINVVRANYGRFSLTVCNENGSTDWSVNCMSSKAFQVLKAKCNGNKYCTMAVSVTNFDDPCPGTSKYLVAQYSCVPVKMSVSTVRPSPPWLTTSVPSIWAITPSIFQPKTTVSAPQNFSEEVVTSPNPNSGYIISDMKDAGNINSWSSIPETVSQTNMANSSSFIPQERVGPGVNEEQMTPLCQPAVSRDLAWNWTAAGNLSIQACPGGASGFARWECHLMSDNWAERVPNSPDLSECRSVWLNELERRIFTNDTLTKIALELSQVTASTNLFGGDLGTTTKMIRSMAVKMSREILKHVDVKQREALVRDLLRSVVEISSNILDTKQLPSWNDLSIDDQIRVAGELLVGIEENSFLLADTVILEKTVTHCSKHLLLSVHVIETRSVADKLFPTRIDMENCFSLGNKGRTQTEFIAKDRQCV